MREVLKAAGLQVVLKDVAGGATLRVADVVAAEGQYATRQIRVFRYYQDRSADILAVLEGDGETAEGEEEEETREARLPAALAARIMLEELLALNRNLGNFLWTGFVTPLTAYQVIPSEDDDRLQHTGTPRLRRS